MHAIMLQDVTPQTSEMIPVGSDANAKNFRLHSKQGVVTERPPTGGDADPAAPARGGADPATSTNSTGAKGKLPRTSVRHALYNL